MPIRPENRERYPKDWKQIRQRILQRANNCCERCGLENGEVGSRSSDGEWNWPFDDGTGPAPKPGDRAICDDGREHKLIRIVLTIAHLNHKPEDCRDENLRAWCQRCHNQYDAKTRASGIKKRRMAQNASGDLFG